MRSIQATLDQIEGRPNSDLSRARRSESSAPDILGRTVMERAIRVPEILSMIFEHCSPGTLAVCACVEHSWEPPALAELWRDLPSFTPLAFVLGDPEQSEENDPNATPGRGFDAEKWPRFARLNWAVRSVRFHSWTSSVSGIRQEIMNPRVIRNLVAFAASFNSPLFPNLRRLECTLQGLESGWDIHNLLVPTIQHVRIEMKYVSFTGVANVLRRLNYCPKIGHIHFPWTPPSNDPEGMRSIVQALRHAATGAKSIHSLLFDPAIMMYPGVWNIISSLPDLHTLRSTNFDTRAPSAIMPLRTWEGGFPSLKRTVMDVDLGSALRLLSQPLPQKLHNVSLFVQGEPFEEPDLVNLFGKVRTSMGAVRSLSIGLGYSAPRLTMPVFRELFHLKKLRKVRILGDKAAAFTDDDYNNIASSLPHLMTLFVMPCPVSDLSNGDRMRHRTPLNALSSKAGLRSLTYLATCKRLESLGIFIDCSINPPSSSARPWDSQPDDPASTRTQPTFRSLKTINMGLSLIGEDQTFSTAAFLAQLMGTRKVKIVVDHVEFDGRLSPAPMIIGGGSIGPAPGLIPPPPVQVQQLQNAQGNIIGVVIEGVIAAVAGGGAGNAANANANAGGPVNGGANVNGVQGGVPGAGPAPGGPVPIPPLHTHATHVHANPIPGRSSMLKDSKERWNKVVAAMEAIQSIAGPLQKRVSALEHKVSTLMNERKENMGSSLRNIAGPGGSGVQSGNGNGAGSQSQEQSQEQSQVESQGAIQPSGVDDDDFTAAGGGGIAGGAAEDMSMISIGELD